MLPAFLIRFLRSWLFITLAILIALSAAIYFLGQAVGWDGFRPLDSLTEKIVTIAILWTLFFSFFLIRWILRRRKNRKVEEDIVEAEADPTEDLIAGEVGELKTKLKTALASLRKSKLGRRSLYELPWYVMIGPPGAGKTTAIVNSGLQFPLAEEMGSASLKGVGGTRNCDWWFTNDAVMIDTAGRYTLQDSDAEVDSKSWLGFLDLLKKHRRRQPINGALIAISLSDLSMQDETTQMEHARAVRRRLLELRERLGVRFPIYVLFTKADLVAGFSEFFETLGREDRQQVWGFTFDRKRRPEKDDPAVPGFEQGFVGLLSQLNAQALERMQQETDPARRALISGFPSQFATLRQIAHDFLTEVFQESRFQDRQMLRGVYFTSGTQEGTPIDRLMMSMAKTFGIGRQAIGTGRGTGRAFFLKRLLEDVIFKESGLVSSDDRVERRYQIVKWGSIAAAVLVAAGLSTVWVRSYLGNDGMIANAAETAEAYKSLATAIPTRPGDDGRPTVADSDFSAVNQALNTLRDQPLNPTLQSPVVPDGTGWGLYQGEIIGDEFSQTYRAALNEHFLPRLLVRMEERIQESVDSPGALYDALKVYMMLGNQSDGNLSEDFVKEYMANDWNATYQGAAQAELRDDLAKHLEALLAGELSPPDLNGDLKERAQEIIGEMPLDRRVYAGILKGTAATQLPDWRLTDVGGADLATVIVRSSGKPLNEPIDGIYTYNGFNDVFLPEALAVSRQVQNENWVLGKYGEEEISDERLVNLARDVLNLYYNDYVAQYQGILNEIDVIPLENAQHAADVTRILAGATSPIRSIFEAIRKETTLTEERSLVNSESLTEDATSLVEVEARSTLDFRSRFILDQIMRIETQSGQSAPAPGKFVEDQFAAINRLVTPPAEGQPTRLDQIIEIVRLVNKELTEIITTQGEFGATAPTGESAVKRLQVEVASIDGPLKRWASQIADGSSGIRAEGTRGTLNAKWAQILPTCNDAVKDRFPFFPSSKSDVPISAFNELFKPSGRIDQFFKENLQRYVDTRSRPWAFKPGANEDLGLSPEVLKQFEFADQIKRTFFANGTSISVAFQIKGHAAGEFVDEALLEIDGQQIRLIKGQGSVTAGVNWPGVAGSARIAFAPLAQNRENAITKDGPWGFFRLLRASQVRTIPGSDQLSITFKVGGRLAQFRLRADTILNPLTLPALTKFRCPSAL